MWEVRSQVFPSPQVRTCESTSVRRVSDACTSASSECSSSAAKSHRSIVIPVKGRGAVLSAGKGPKGRQRASTATFSLVKSEA